MKYEIKGGAFPVVVCYLDNGETMITEKGSMVWQTPNMMMSTTGGGIGKMFSKAFSGESMFQNIYTAQGGPGMIAFGSSFPGKILPLQIEPGKELIVQKRAFLASEIGVELSIHFNKRSAQAFLAAKALLCRGCPARGWRLLRSTANWSNTNWRLGSSLLWIPGTSPDLKQAFPLIFNRSPA